ncbi:MAG: gfo/Idh/MocA family oxidoreductase [Chloroflexi bacterium]|nr:MAG: gfo/Idh/MocA family oxidoreductase [Chloroflexota bacterium]
MTTIAYVGCAHIHTPGFVNRLNNRDDVTVKSVWDHQHDRAARYAHELGAAVVADVTDIWRDDTIEAVVICAETKRHEALVLDAAAAKKHLFVEKPLGIGAADAYKMARAIDAAGVQFSTGYFQRGSAINQFLKSHIEQGSFGTITRIHHANCHNGGQRGYFDDEWAWMADLEQAGVGAFGDMGTHSLDLMMWLLGDVSAVIADFHPATGRFGETDEYGEGLLRFTNGVTGVLSASWVHVGFGNTALISGTEGSAYYDERGLVFKSAHIDGADGESLWTDLPDALPHAFELFFDALGGADAPLVTPQEAAQRSAVMEALYRSMSEGRWVQPLAG